jgi:hypothetical protein
VEHWHGSSPDSSFAYLAVTPTQKGKTIWLEPVSDKDYNSLNAKGAHAASKGIFTALLLYWQS